MHLFWLALFVPAVILGQWLWPILKRRSIWAISAGIVFALVMAWLAVCANAMDTSQRNVLGILKSFGVQVILATELPLIQLLAACGVGWFWSKREPVVQHCEAKPEA